MNIQRLLQLFIFGVAFGVSAQTVRYVSPTGSDMGDCSNSSTPCASISYAVAEAGTGDIIEISDGLYTESIHVQTPKNLSFVGESEASTIIQAHQNPNTATTRVLQFGNDNVHISNLTIKNGAANEGGGIKVSGGITSITNVTISDNQAAHFGGGLYASLGELDLVDVTFENNSTTTESFGGGGGMYVHNLDLSMSGVSFENNTSARLGGGILTRNVQTPQALQNVQFIGNKSNINGFIVSLPKPYGGGAIYNYDSYMLIQGAVFTNNEAVANGGAIYNGEDGTMELIDVELNGNQAGINGGGIYNESELEMSGLYFYQNTTFRSGGGLYNINETSLTIRESTFESNEAMSITAGRGGGAFYNEQNIPVEILNCHFISNISGNGGGIYFNTNDSVPRITNTRFYKNEANLGGALYGKGASLELINTSIYANQGFYGGGGIVQVDSDSTTLNLKNSIIWGNEGGNNGNDILNVGDHSSVELSFCLYSDTVNDIIEGGEITATDCITGNPSFRDADNGDLRLKHTSLAINEGDPNTNMEFFPLDGTGTPLDIIGNPRLYDQRIDIGAYEWDGELSVNSFWKKNISVYPNPVKNKLHIVGGQQITDIEMFDLQGRIIHIPESKLGNDRDENYIVDISEFSQGTYFIRVHTLNEKQTFKVIKE